jgi:sialate O-acetylesterase
MKKKFEIHSLIGDGMVIQHGERLPVWGYGEPGLPVEVRFQGKVYQTGVDNSGNWQVLLHSSGPGGPYEMSITACGAGQSGEDYTITIRNIYAGDVWICSGQSNMELPMARLKDEYPEEWEMPNPLIRQFPVPVIWDFSGPRKDVTGGGWVAAAPETLDDFSGTGWFFAKKLYEKHKIPVGLIKAAAGGSPIESWMSKEALKDFPHKIAESAVYRDSGFVDEKMRENSEKQTQWLEKLQKSDQGLAERAEWFKPDIDDSSWEDMELPGPFYAGVLKDYCGVIWLRKTINIPPALTGKEAKIWLGTIIDADTVYINGKEVGNTSYRYPPRKYNIPAGILRDGANQITIRVVCNNGGGGVTNGKPFRIFADAWSTELKGTWKYKAPKKIESRPPDLHIEWRPCGLFNAMIMPLLSYPVKGIIWYQGESNTANAEEYTSLFLSMIQDWRNKKRQPELPFLFVQLPIFGEPAENTEHSKWAVIRNSQFKILELPNTGMAAALDLGEWNDLHPLNKKDVGFRLALAAETVVYHEKNNTPGPILKEVTRENNNLILTFDKAGAGLVVRDDRPQPGGTDTLYLTVISKDKKANRVAARLKGPNQIVVDIPIQNPEKILYAWADNPADRHLYNADGLPAIPFNINIVTVHGIIAQNQKV